MKGENEMNLALSISAAIILVLSIFFIFFMRHYPKISSWIIFGLAVFLLLFKSIEYSIYAITKTGYSPIEFSHLSYLIYGVVFTFGFVKMGMFGGFVALLSGFGFLMGAILSPASINSIPTQGMEYGLYLVIMGYITHTFLFLGGGLALFCHRCYSLRQMVSTYIGLYSMVFYGVLVYVGALYNIQDPAHESNFIGLITGEYIVRYFGDGISVFGKFVAALSIIALVTAAVPVVQCFSNIVVHSNIEYAKKHNIQYEAPMQGVVPFIEKAIEGHQEKKSLS